MITELEKFPSGCYGLGIGLGMAEIDALIHRLNDLKQKNTGHFHCRSKLESAAIQVKVIDIEFFLTAVADDASHDMELE